MKSLKLLAIIFFLLILAGCAPKATSVGDYSTSYDREAQPAVVEQVVVQEVSASGSNILDSTAAAQVERVVIKNASISIIVDDPAAVLDTITQLAEEKGGFIVNSNLYKTQTEQGLEVPAANLTIRIPAESLIKTLEEIKALLKDPEKDVQYENITGQDVTQEYLDLKSRLRNLEQAKEKLDTIMAETYKTEDVLSVYNELTRVTEQIEVLKGQIQYYDEASRLSAVEITIVARESVKDLTIGGWQPAGVARKAIQALIDTMEFLVNAVIWVGLYILPVGICLLIPVALVYWGIRKILRNRKMRKSAGIAEMPKEGISPEK